MGSLTLCNHCLTFSGVHVKGNRCCRARLLANMPRERVTAEFDRVRATSGEAAATELREDALAEYTRRRAFLRSKI